MRAFRVDVMLFRKLLNDSVMQIHALGHTAAGNLGERDVSCHQTVIQEWNAIYDVYFTVEMLCQHLSGIYKLVIQRFGTGTLLKIGSHQHGFTKNALAVDIIYHQQRHTAFFHDPAVDRTYEKILDRITLIGRNYRQYIVTVIAFVGKALSYILIKNDL